MDKLEELKAKFDVKRVPAEDADDVRARDDAEIDALYYRDGRRVGDRAGKGLDIYGRRTARSSGWRH